MSDSLELDFKKSDSFIEQFNLKFTVSDMKSSSDKFQLVMVSSCFDDFVDCVDGNGVLVGSLTNSLTDSPSGSMTHTLPCSLKWEKMEDTVNVRLRNEVEAEIDDGVVEDLRAIFLTNLNGYVLMYCIFHSPLQITNTFTFEEDCIFFSIE